MDFLIDILREKDLNSSEIALIENSFLLLITLPIVTTLSGVMRHIIGLKSLSVYAPIVLTFAFYELGYIEENGESNLLRGLKFGVTLFLIVFFVTAFVYKYLRTLRMHYVPKTSIVLICVSLSIMATIFLGTFLFERKGLVYVDIFSVIMIATLSETFVSLLSRKDFNHSLKIAFQTLLIAIATYSVISLPSSRGFLIDYGLIVIIGLTFINFYIGRFIGLRITEYWRFKDLIFQDTADNTNAKPKSNKKK